MKSLLLPLATFVCVAIFLATPIRSFSDVDSSRSDSGSSEGGSDAQSDPREHLELLAALAEVLGVPKDHVVLPHRQNVDLNLRRFMELQSNTSNTTLPPATPAPIPTFNCDVRYFPGDPYYAAWLSWVSFHCTTAMVITSPAPTPSPTNFSTNFTCNSTVNRTDARYAAFIRFYNSSCNNTNYTTTTAPRDRSGILPLFYEPSVLAKTPIITVGTFLVENSGFQSAAFSQALSARLRNATNGLIPFQAADAVNVIQVTNCEVDKFGLYGATPISPYMCRSKQPCTGRLACGYPGVTTCVCPAVAKEIPLNDSYTTPAPNTAPPRRSRRANANAFIQVQFVIRLDYAASYWPSTSSEIADMLNRTLPVIIANLKDRTFTTALQIDSSFLFVRFAYDNFETVDYYTIPSEPELLWLLTLLVIPIVLLGIGAFRFFNYYKWKRYGQSLSVRAGGYSTTSEKEQLVAEGLGKGQWAEGTQANNDAVEMTPMAPDDAMMDFDLVIEDDVR